MGEAKRRKISGAIGRAIDKTIGPDREMIARRDKIKTELRRLIELADLDKIEAIVWTEIPEQEFDDEGKRRYATSMIGEVDVIKMTCANVVMHYSERTQKKAGIGGKDHSIKIMG